MFTINIKGKANPKKADMAKLEMVLFKTGYPRVSKILTISGPIKEWDQSSQQFTGKSKESVETNKHLLDLKSRYLATAQAWESEGRAWSPVQWSHCFDREQKKRAEKEACAFAFCCGTDGASVIHMHEAGGCQPITLTLAMEL